MLVRVALHQTRLLTPGLVLDERGVAAGPRVAVLFASLDRLVAFLAAMSEQGTFDEVLPGLELRELVSSSRTTAAAAFADAVAGGRLDALRSVAALVGGHAFTGASRHFVELRDASAPYGFDVSELSTSTATHVFYHRAYTQGFDEVRTLGLEALTLSLRLGLGDRPASGERYLLIEPGLAGVAASYLRRSGVAASISSASVGGRDAVLSLLHVPALPRRMARLFDEMPGVASFVPDVEGYAAAVGMRHPFRLGALPPRPSGDLVLLPADGPAIRATGLAWVSLAAVGRIEAGVEPLVARGRPPPELATAQLVLVPRATPRRDASAAWVPNEELPMLRRLLYLVGASGRLAVFDDGALVVAEPGELAPPLGQALYRVGTSAFVPIGFDLAPRASDDAIEAALRLPKGAIAIFRPGAPARACDADALVPVGRALARGPAWAALAPKDLDWKLDEPLAAPERVEVTSTDPGVFPLARVE